MALTWALFGPGTYHPLNLGILHVKGACSTSVVALFVVKPLASISTPSAHAKASSQILIDKSDPLVSSLPTFLMQRRLLPLIIW
jgi:hypothetical protein